MKIILFLIFTMSALFSWAGDIEEEQEPLVLVGDVFVPQSSIIPESASSRGFIQKNTRLWTDGIIRYQFSNSLSDQRRSEFLRYCREMGEFADIQCLPRRSQDSDYIFIRKTNSGPCGLAYLGRYGGRQPLDIQCWRRRTIQHELMHSFGIPHEHNRMDRDEHITILWENIESRYKSAYSRVSMGRIGKYLNYYDFASIMHYGSSSGARPGRTAFYRTDLGPQSGKMNQTSEMSFGDHYILYALYGGERPR